MTLHGFPARPPAFRRRARLRQPRDGPARLVADRAPPALRGSAFGLFDLATGGAMLAAGVTAGLLWDSAGPAATFLAGAGFAIAAALALIVSPPARRSS